MKWGFRQVEPKRIQLYIVQGDEYEARRPLQKES